MLLIDEVDRADDEFEAFLLEILSDYSVQAWADLAHGERRIRVGGIDGGVLPPVGGASGAPRPDELVVRLPRRRVGY